MTKFIKMFPFKTCLSIVFVFFLFSCQSEIEELDYNLQETMTANSPLTTYLQRVAMVKTVQDNIIDNSSYCTVKLPYTLVVNNTAIALNNTADYQKVWDNINAYTTDNDIVTLNFPVTMVYYNYIEKPLQNQTDFNYLLDYWNLFPDILYKINGVNINYPITINVYNNANQIASTVGIASDQAFFSFIKNLSSSQYISLSYPLSIINYKYQKQTIANNLEFENAIKYALDYFPENNLITLDFKETIIKDSWKITYFYNESEKTSYFNSYIFVFNSDKTVVATKDGISVTGQWETKLEYDGRELKVNFGSGLLSKLNHEWKVFEFNNSKIHLRDISVGNNTNYLYFEKN